MISDEENITKLEDEYTDLYLHIKKTRFNR